MARSLDFIVIGAAKSATTTLHELLKNHPDIYIPNAKEVPFFSDEAVFRRGLENYFETYFKHAGNTQRLGTITPQYMIDGDDVDTEIIAKRIHDSFPKAKLIALLRNPAERAFSHYKMVVQRGYETRSFDTIVNSVTDNPDLARKSTKSLKSYVFTSEYGRILENYYKLFPKNNILVITTNELRDDPEKTIQSICKFIGVDSTYIPKGANKKHREGGSKPKLRLLTPGFLYSIPFVERAWKGLTPQFIRKNVEYFLNLWNTRRDNTKLDKDSDTYARLRQFYKNDTNKLEKMVRKKMPWSY
tara:strand:- start:10710 stop:11612 length:903 start_codon:yes stop_codon:yes gene_type:complete